MTLDTTSLVANVPAHDLERARRWYEEKLGISPIMDLGPAGQLYRTGGTLWTIYPTTSAGTGKHTLASFVVPDIEAAMAELRGRGVTFEDYAMGEAGPNTVDGIARDETGGAAAWFIDSEDNVMSLLQVPPGMVVPGAPG